MAAPFPFHPWTTDLAVKEDGRRVALVDSTFEWWYFDTIMDDGSTCVVNFLSKRPFVPGPTAPILQFNIGTPSGKYLQSEASLPANTYSAATDHCDVAMGKSWVKGDLHAYTIHAEGVAEGSGTPMQADLTLRRVVPGWRSGPFLTPEEAATLWLGEQVVIPSGTVEGTLTYDGVTHKVRGSCYHDHQWGGAGAGHAAATPQLALKYWYWGRVQAGDHAVDVAQVYGSVDGGPTVPVTTFWTFARGTEITYDDTLWALTVTQNGERPAPPRPAAAISCAEDAATSDPRYLGLRMVPRRAARRVTARNGPLFPVFRAGHRQLQRCVLPVRLSRDADVRFRWRDILKGRPRDLGDHGAVGNVPDETIATFRTRQIRLRAGRR